MARVKKKYIFILLGLASVPLILLFFFRDDDSAVLGGNVLGFNNREAKLAQRVKEMEDQNTVLRHQLSLSQHQLLNLQSSSAHASDAANISHQTAGGPHDTLGGPHDTPGGHSKPCSSHVQDEIPKCEVLHVSVVCAGYNSTRDIITLVKSVLFYRRNPLHLHVIADYTAQHILETVFDTWRVPAVDVSFYQADDLKSEVSWIPNKHYSGVYGLMKLTLPNTLPHNLTKVKTDFTGYVEIQLTGIIHILFYVDELPYPLLLGSLHELPASSIVSSGKSEASA